jgi:hypothetical protein
MIDRRPIESRPARRQEHPPMLRRTSFATLLLASVFLGGAPSAAAEDESAFTDPVVAKLNDRVLRFLNEIAERRETDAFRDLLSGSQLAEQTAAVKTLVDRSKELAERYGAYRESEAVGGKRVGKDLVLLKYLYKCEKFPVVWRIAYYRDASRTTANSDDAWVVISVRFDTQLDQLGN